MTKPAISRRKGRLNALLSEIDDQHKGRKIPTEKEILKEIQAYRKEKRRANDA